MADRRSLYAQKFTFSYPLFDYMKDSCKIGFDIRRVDKRGKVDSCNKWRRFYFTYITGGVLWYQRD